jgi:hypothetical protein
MKTIGRRALVALAFGFLTFGAGTSLAKGLAASCCEKAESCCSSGCCRAAERKLTNETAERFRAKYGREYPGTAPAAQAHDCCKNCC